MASRIIIENQLTSVLNQAAEYLNLTNFSLNIDLSAKKGDGFLGELYKVSILNKETNTRIALIIKKAPVDQRRREATCIKSAYKNEILFYTKILTTLKQFQRERQVTNPFDSIPEYLASINEIGQEMIVLKDITVSGFEMREKNLLLDEEHASFIFKTYGRFHALSFCLKDQKPQEYNYLTKSVHNVMVEFCEKDSFSYALAKIAKKCLETLDPDQDSAILEKYQKYVDKTMEIFSETIHYKGQYSGILHGDCWSNNIMFKYQNSQLKDINLLDFQLLSVGTPVYDLSYFFYSGGTRELFKKLNYYLDIYHKSFSQFAKELGSDPEQILPREVLTEDWKQYSRFGMLMAILLTQIKLMTKEDSIQVAESTNGVEENREKFFKAKINEEVFNERVRNILLHMNEIGAL